MSKRPADGAEANGGALKNQQRPEKSNGPEQDQEFEDEFEDEFESEDEIFEAGEDGQADNSEGEQEPDPMQIDKETFIPGRTKLSAGETLSPDLSTYQILHTLSSTWPCLSFDILDDPFSPKPQAYPLTLYAVAGTQAEARRSKENEVMVLKLSGLSKTDTAEDDESSNGSDEEDSDPILESKSIPVPCTVNRVRAFQSSQSSSLSPPNTVAAAMLENGSIRIFDITSQIASFNTPGMVVDKASLKPLTTITRHKTEGYALDWAPSSTHPLGKLATGDGEGLIYVTSRNEAGEWFSDSRAFTGHQDSVEEIQWSPTEKNVFASGASDGTVKIWDLRSKSRTAQLSTKISDKDVNVMSWSRTTTFNLATGDDAGALAVWDLRKWKPNSTAGTGVFSGNQGEAMVRFNFHKRAITSVEWHPSDDSVLLVGSEDNTISLWDLGVELDDEESQDTQGMHDVPPQLLFVHYMENAKEAHWINQHPGTVMATGEAGFSVFKTISI